MKLQPFLEASAGPAWPSSTAQYSSCPSPVQPPCTLRPLPASILLPQLTFIIYLLLQLTRHVRPSSPGLVRKLPCATLGTVICQQLPLFIYLDDLYGRPLALSDSAKHQVLHAQQWEQEDGLGQQSAEGQRP